MADESDEYGMALDSESIVNVSDIVLPTFDDLEASKAAPRFDTTPKSASPKKEQQTTTANPKTSKTRKLVELFNKIYENKYYWDIAKSVIIFLTAIKVAHECKKIAIPLKEYQPFSNINLSVCTCK